MRIKSVCFSGFMVVVLLVSCNNSKNEIFMTIDRPLNIISAPDRIVEFSIDVKADNAINRFWVTAKEPLKPTQTITDSALAFPSKKFKMEYFYRVPNRLDTLNIVVNFHVSDVNGNSFNLVRQIVSVPDARLLPETTGHLLYTRGGTNPNTAFNLKKLEPLTYSDSSAALIDIYDTTTKANLSYVWHSLAKGRFVKFNSFDYAKATNLSVRDAYKAGIKQDFAVNLAKDDILLYYVPQGNNDFYAVVRIVNIVNDTAARSFRYEFNVKK